MEDLNWDKVIVSREGASHRTVEELLRQLLVDAFDVTGNGRFEGLIAEYDAVLADDAGGYEWERFEQLHGMADDAESWLVDMGYVVDWNDGYTISEA